MPKASIRVGKDKIIEPGVILGLDSSRAFKPRDLCIGAHAHLRAGTMIYLGTRIGDSLQTGHHAVIREQNRIGDRFSLWSHSVVDYDCTIGDGVKIHCNCYVAQYSTIEDDVFLAPGVVLANDPHPGAPDPKRCMKGPTIRRGAQIGCNVTILPAVVIGEHALIGAGSVVTRDIPARSLAYGNPARVVKTLDQVRCRARDHRPYDFLFA